MTANKIKAYMKRQVLFIFCFITLTSSLYPQNQRKIDSLFNVINTTKQDTTKAEAYANICDAYSRSNPDTAMYFGNLGLKLAKEANYKKGIAVCYIKIGNIYEGQCNYPTALDFYKKSLKIREELGNKKGIAISYNNMGAIYKDQGNYPLALEYYQKSLIICEALGDKQEMSNCYNSIGNVHREQSNYSQALEYYKKSLKIEEELRDKQQMSYCYNNIGVVYSDQGNTKQAIESYQKCLKILEELGDKKGMAGCYNNVGESYTDIKNFALAIEYFQKSLKIYEELGDKQGMSLNYNNVADVYIKLKDYNKAITFALKGLQIAKEIGTLFIESVAYENLSTSFKGLGKYREALENYEMFKQMNDSIFNLDKHKQIAQMEAIYQNEKKQKEIEINEVQLAKKEVEIKHQKTLTFTFVGGFVLAVLIAFLILWSLQRKKRDNKIIAAEKAKSEELLLNILPSKTAEELKKYGHSDARSFDMISVLFTDFKGFTELAEKFTAEKLVAELDHCFRAFDQLMGKYNIEKIKTIGDSYMCAGGIPVLNTTNPVDIVKCGIEIQHFMETYKEERIKEDEPYFELRIGIHTGPIVAGIVGLKKFAYDIWGDTVNIASRMESSGEVGKVNISGATYELIKDKFECTYRGKILAKNKGEIDMYFVEGIL